MERVLAAAAAAAFAFGLGADGASASVYIQSISASWANADMEGSGTGPNAPVINNAGNPIKAYWGGYGDSQTPNGPSGYEFKHVTVPQTATESPFKVGDFTHANNPVWGPWLQSIDLVLNMTVRLGGAEGPEYSVVSTYTFFHEETPNQAPCAYPGGDVCADKVTFQYNPSASTPVWVPGDVEGEGAWYTIALSGFSAGSDAPLLDYFITREKKNNVASLYASWTYEPVANVPLPAAGLLLLGGLGGLGLVARRRTRG